MMTALFVIVAMLFVAICAWKLVLLGLAITRVRTASARRRPLVSQAIRAHTLHLLLAAFGIALLLIGSRLPADVHLYVAYPMPPTATPTTVVTDGPPIPKESTPTPTTTAPPTSVPPQAHLMRLRRVDIEAFPPFAPGFACDDEPNANSRKARAQAVRALGEELAREYRQGAVQFILVVGTFDHTSLSRATSRRYDSNSALAQERAECVAATLRAVLKEQAASADWTELLHTMIAGPQYARHHNPDDRMREHDRGVRVLVGGDVVERTAG